MKEEILNSQLKNVELFGEFKSHKAEIDTEDLSWILQILSTNLYSDPIGSLIREYSSNAWDANVEAGNKNKPIEVGLQTSKDQGSYWYVTDLGLGLSPERIEGVYRKFGKSTKRNSNEAIGMMGLGKFSGLSYTNEVYITTRVDGREYEYLMHKSEGTPQIDLLIDKPTTNPNGTTIKIFIADYYDKKEFKQKMLEQLAYFENVYYNVDDMPSLNQDIKLIKGKTFTYSNQDKRELRIKLGPVSYPIDKVIKSNTNLYNYSGLALNFNIGELAITPNRESILYNKKTIEAVELKLNAFHEELIEIYNNMSTEYEDIDSYITALNYTKITIGNNQYPVDNTRGIKLKTPILKGLDLELQVINDSDLFTSYKSHSTYSGSKRSKEHTHTLAARYLSKEGLPCLIVDSIAVDPKKVRYIYENNVTPNNQGSSMHLIKYNIKNIKLKDEDYNGRLSHSCYYYILKLNTIPKAKWRETIKKFQEWQKKYVESKCIIYNNITVPKSWLNDQKTVITNNNVVALRKSAGKILMYFAEKANRWGGIASFVGRDVLISKLEANTKFTIYGEELFKDELKTAYLLLSNYKNFNVVVTAEKNHKYLNLFPQYIHVTEFLKGNSKHFRKAVGSYLFMQHGKKISDLVGCLDALKYVNPIVAEEVKELHNEAYSLQNDKDRYVSIGSSNDVEKSINLLLTNALIDKKVDHESLFKMSRIDYFVEKYGFITMLKLKQEGPYKKSYSEDVLNFAVWVGKKQKVKLEFKHYLKKEINDITGSEGKDTSADSTID